MRALIQRVHSASVHIDGKPHALINEGLLIFLGFGKDVTSTEMQWMTKKITQLRIFEDDDQKMNLSVKDIEGDVLIVSQFTLYGNCLKGNRPNFRNACPPQEAKKHYDEFIDLFTKSYPYTVKHGKFGAMMDVSLVNNGPVTFWLEKSPAEL